MQRISAGGEEKIRRESAVKRRFDIIYITGRNRPIDCILDFLKTGANNKINHFIISCPLLFTSPVPLSYPAENRSYKNPAPETRSARATFFCKDVCRAENRMATHLSPCARRLNIYDASVNFPQPTGGARNANRQERHPR